MREVLPNQDLGQGFLIPASEFGVKLSDTPYGLAKEL